jgi:hypothetical protein
VFLDDLDKLREGIKHNISLWIAILYPLDSKDRETEYYENQIVPLIGYLEKLADSI